MYKTFQSSLSAVSRSLWSRLRDGDLWLEPWRPAGCLSLQDSVGTDSLTIPSTFLWFPATRGSIAVFVRGRGPIVAVFLRGPANATAGAAKPWRIHPDPVLPLAGRCGVKNTNPRSPNGNWMHFSVPAGKWKESGHCFPSTDDDSQWILDLRSQPSRHVS